MRIPIGLCIILTVAAWAQPASKPEKLKKDAKSVAPALPKLGIKTPGVQIPFASLKAEAEFAVAPPWLIFTDAPLFPDLEKDSLIKIDTKENKLGAPITGLSKPCGGAISAFTSLWIPVCGQKSIVRFDAKAAKITQTLPTGTGVVAPQIAASTDSIWAFTDDKTTLSRIDPEQNTVVAEIRLFADCNSLTFGETALWVTCPAENRVLRSTR